MWRSNFALLVFAEAMFAAQNHRFGLFVRTTGRARTRIGLANLAYNLKRLLWIEAQPVAA